MSKSSSDCVLLNINHECGTNTAKLSGLAYFDLILKKFPDKEHYIRIPFNPKGKKVFLLCDFSQDPSAYFTVALFISRTLKLKGAKKVYLIAPYMVYLRQDKEFNPGEVVSGTVFSKFVSQNFDGVITIDPHLHRIENMHGFFSCKAQKLTATDLISDYLGKRKDDFIVVGPDIESKQWVKQIADKIGRDYYVALKKRFGSRKVAVDVSEEESFFKGRKIVIVDDIISTGHTILEAAKSLKKKKIGSIECLCVHGIFAEGALDKLRRVGVRVHSTNTLKNDASFIDVSSVLAEGIKKWL